MLPSERSLCNRRFVVVFGKPSVVAIFLLPRLWAANLSMAKSSSAERTILVVKMLKNTWDLRQMWLWCMDFVSRVIDVRRCEMCKNLLFCHIFRGEAFFITRGP